MKIERQILYQIIQEMPTMPPEIGGIIGGKDDIATVYAVDKGKGSRGCCYRPDINILNSIIDRWEVEQYTFMGIFHVHFYGCETISRGDREYIEIIMQTMPKRVNSLFFPIVVQPQEKMIPYYAYRTINDKIIIRRDELIIL